MVPVPVSAFEVYQKAKQAKKKSSKKKNKNKDVKVNPLIAAELQKAADVLAETKKKKNKVNDGAHKQTSSEADGESSGNVGGSHSDSDKPSISKEAVTSLYDVSSLKKLKKKKKSREAVNESHLLSGNPKQSQTTLVHPMNTSAVNLSEFENSIETAEKFFSWLIEPIEKDTFFSDYWEKRPVHISRDKNRNYYSRILSTIAIDNMLRKNNILFGKNIDITSYNDGKRQTLNSVGRAHAAVVWDFYRDGCSVRLLNPQTYHTELRELNTRLQEVFGSFVGANAYLTPPNSQGFAPHYDDIEAFVLQIEGQKMWRVYAPRNSYEKLPRTSSPNFTQEEIGNPILEVLVKAGDLLYFPRGFIHQASTVKGQHSLHVTVSTYQRNSWADLLEKLVPAALANAIEEDEEFRKGMPPHIMNHLGVVHCESESSERNAAIAKIKKLFSKLFDYAPVDPAADQLAKEFIHDALPPCLSSAEKKCSVLENSERMGSDGNLQGTVTVALDTCIRLTRSNVLRLVSEEEPDTMKIYHSMENSLEYHGEDLQCIEIPVKLALAVEHLIVSYPNFTAICDLPLEDDLDKIQIAIELWERGLVLTECPVPVSSVDDW